MKEEITGEGHGIPHFTTEQIIYRHTQFLADNIKAGKFDGGMQLGPIIVEAPSWVADFKTQRLESKAVMTNQIGF